MLRFLALAILCVGGVSAQIWPNATMPQQVHLAFAGNSSSAMSVTWVTYNDTQTHTVQYGVSSGVYKWTATGKADNYGWSWIHNVVLEDLQPSTTYYYVVGDASAAEGWSSEFTFTTSAVAEFAGPWPFTVGCYGDMGISNSENTIVQLASRMDNYQFIYHVGDFSYADDRFLEPWEYEQIWNDWANLVEPFAARRAYMVLPGNHEASCRSIGSMFCDARHDNFTAYRYRFNMPYKQSGAVNNMWYSFDYSYVHFISVDTETDYPSSPEGPDTLWNAGPFGDQLAWLEADLAAAAAPAARAQRPWIIVAGHRPMYTTSSGDFPSNAVTVLRQAMEGLFIKYGVDLYMAAHVHAYERMWPICNGNVEQNNYANPSCPVYIVNGAAGNTEGHNTWGDLQPFVAYRTNADYGFGELTIHNSTTLSWNFLRATDGGVDDSFVLYKEH